MVPGTLIHFGVSVKKFYRLLVSCGLLVSEWKQVLDWKQRFVHMELRFNFLICIYKYNLLFAVEYQ